MREGVPGSRSDGVETHLSYQAVNEGAQAGGVCKPL